MGTPEHPQIPFPEGYPFDLSDRDLAAAVRDMILGWRRVSGSPDSLTKVGAEVALAYINLGAQEQSRRAVQQATRSAQLTSYIAIAIALVGVLVAITGSSGISRRRRLGT
jgi:hypothetical protein